jgi:transposase InsO family protein
MAGYRADHVGRFLRPPELLEARAGHAEGRLGDEQKGIVERFFRSLTEECVWQHLFPSFADARRGISAWIRWYSAERPHQALGHRSPVEWRAQQLTQMARLEGSSPRGRRRGRCCICGLPRARMV